MLCWYILLVLLCVCSVCSIVVFIIFLLCCVLCCYGMARSLLFVPAYTDHEWNYIFQMETITRIAGHRMELTTEEEDNYFRSPYASMFLKGNGGCYWRRERMGRATASLPLVGATWPWLT